MFSRTVSRSCAIRLPVVSRNSPLLAAALTTTLTTTPHVSLSASKARWFTRSPTREFASYGILPGDWICQECDEHNFARRLTCRCGAPKHNLLEINSTNLPAPIGPYSHAVKTSFGIFVSGQLPADSKGNLVEGTMRQKTEAVFKNLKEVLVTARTSLDNIVKVQVFLTDMKDFDEMNEEYKKWITHKPARSCVAVKELPKGPILKLNASPWLKNSFLYCAAEKFPIILYSTRCPKSHLVPCHLFSIMKRWTVKDEMKGRVYPYAQMMGNSALCCELFKIGMCVGLFINLRESN